MKIYLSPRQNKDYEALGYMHIPDVSKLDIFVDDAECTDIILDGYICTLPNSLVKKHLSKIISKVRLNGLITVVDLNGLSLIYNLMNDLAFSLDDFNNVLEEASALSFHSPISLREIFEDYGLQTKQIRFEDSFFILEVCK